MSTDYYIGCHECDLFVHVGKSKCLEFDEVTSFWAQEHVQHAGALALGGEGLFSDEARWTEVEFSNRYAVIDHQPENGLILAPRTTDAVIALSRWREDRVEEARRASR